MEVLRHDKETFREYLTFIGFSASEMESITKRLGEHKADKEDMALFLHYIAGKDFKNLYDE